MNTHRTLELLRRYESRNVTFQDPDGTWPIVWERARGTAVWDEAGRRYLDWTAAFGVAAAGHANPRVVRAGQRQMASLPHAMGDVHPHALKARLARELSRLTYERWTRRRQQGRTLFCNSGFEAVEAALKTARMATGRPGIVAFEGAYHGLGYGTLNATHRHHFRGPFLNQLKRFGHFVPFPARTAEGGSEPMLNRLETRIRGLFRRHRIGAILVEPVQARGGIHVPPPEFLCRLRSLCDRHGALLVLDEIYTGFGRTGRWFACEHSGVVPDLICLGKALTGGFPLSACVGQSEVMDAAWPASSGEAIHTSTFLGHPVGCAMALTQVAEIRRLNLVQRSARMGRVLLRELASLHAPRFKLQARGLGLMAGLEVTHPGNRPAGDLVMRVIKAMLQRGFILLPEGEHGNVISFTPPLTLGEPAIQRTVGHLRKVLADIPVETGRRP